jgi:hypothetical protein
MNIPSRGLWHARWLALLVLVAVAVWLPAAQAEEDNGRGSTDGLLAKLSQGAAIGYLRAHPDQAYIEVYAAGGKALVYYNANYRSTRLLDEGFAIPQQDNFLRRTSLGQ